MDDSSLAAGATISHYRVVSKLGTGGMGEIYLAEDTRLHRKVAIKCLPPGSTADERARKRLVREAQAAAALDHPNICTIHEVGEEEGHTFIVMQYCEGETLATRIQSKPLELKEAFEIALQVADALSVAHSRGIIHRDVKPQNIMLTGRGQVKVLDFGLAKVSANRGVLDSEGETKSLLTQAGVILGTVLYMSPEQVKGESLDARSDIFSFGAVLYEMISGHHPFAAQTPAEIISAILTSEPSPLENHSIVVPAGLEQIVRKCLAKDRQTRYQAMVDVAADLESVRGECENNASVTSASVKTAATRRMAVTNHEANRSAFFKSRLGLALAVVIALAAVLSVYALVFRNPRSLPPASVKSVNSAAYDYYLRGRVNAGSQNRENNESAIRILEQVTKADPSFAPAYAELARAYGIKANFFVPDPEKKQLYEDAKVAVEKSLALDPNLAEGHFVRGDLLWTHANRFPHEQAIQSFKRAIALDPNLEEAHHELGVVYMHIGLLDKADEEIKKALAIDPSDTLARFRLGSINVSRGNYEEALAVLKTVPREANPAIVDRATAIALFQLGRTQEASELVEDYLKAYATDEGGNVTSVKAMLLAKAGREREAEETIQRAIDIGKNFQHFHHTTYNIASAYALLNKPDQALKWLQFTADDGFPCYPLFENDASLNGLRKDERFIAFMAKLRQQWERYNATL